MTELVWCIDQNAWLRFHIAHDGKATAEIARIDPANPYLCRPWEGVTSGIWHGFDTTFAPAFRHNYYCLLEGSLYQTHANVNPLTRKITVAKATGPASWINSRVDPFQAYAFLKKDPSPKTQHPLTPEQKLEKWNALKEGVFQRPITMAHGFTEVQQSELLARLLAAVPELIPTSYPSPEAYQLKLRTAIDSPSDSIHEAVVALAGRTVDFIRIPHDPASLAKKKAFYFGLLEDTHQYVLGKFSNNSQLTEIKAAVTRAQANYAAWYRGQSHRGASGFFSWWRHGTYGQNRAITIQQSIQQLYRATDAISQINIFLRDNKTRFHQHSFASFLLDQLITIDESPWSAIPRTRDRYDQATLISHLYGTPSTVYPI